MAGAASVAAAGCGGGNDDRLPTATGTVTGTGPSPSQSPRSGPTAISERHGQTLRHTGFVERDATFDPHKTQAGPFYGHQSLIFSRLLTYQDQAQGVMVPDLAASLPERPEPGTLVFKLNPGAHWHELPPLDGRAVTMDDVRHSVQRQLEGGATFARAPQWSVIESMEVSDPHTMTVKLRAPIAAAQHLFADVASFVVAPELSAGSGEIGVEGQVGSGPFMWVEWNDQRFASVRRNPGWFGGGKRPFVDGLSVVQPRTPSEVESGLRTKDLDVAVVNREFADYLRAAMPQLVEYTVGHSLFFGLRFSLVNHPFNDQRFRNAVTTALDRRALIQTFFGGSGGLSPWVSWPVSRWTLPESELTAVSGYRPGDGGRQEDLREAKSYLEAFLAEKKLPEEPLPLFVPDTTEASIGLGAAIRDQLDEALGLAIRVVPLPLAQLVGLLLTAEAPFTAGPDTGWVDLDDWVYPYFHSSGTKNTFPVRDTNLDALIDSQRLELDESKRQQTGYELQRRLLGINAGVNLVSERVVTLAWPYVQGFPLDISDGYQARFADTWIDRSNPSYRDRS